MKRIRVETSARYDVCAGKGILSETGSLLAKVEGQRYRKAVIVTDDNVAALYLGEAKRSLESAGFEALEFVFPNGERSKSIGTAMEICGFLSEKYFTRKDVVVALGGGVAGDLAGFAASVYQRGCDFIQLPTTFLAAIDSSVGGKTAVNTEHGKNLVGTFWQPRLVVCDTETLETLSGDVFADGVAEAVKYGCIWDEELFGILGCGGARDNLEDLISRCVKIKAEVVKRDENDNAIRRILNFGHTAGHAVEKLSGFEITHGKAVAIGMVIAAKSGEKLGVTEKGTAERIKSALEANNLPTNPPYPIADICAACMGDKKREGGGISYIFLESIGKSVIKTLDTESLVKVLDV